MKQNIVFLAVFFLLTSCGQKQVEEQKPQRQIFPAVPDFQSLLNQKSQDFVDFEGFPGPDNLEKANYIFRHAVLKQQAGEKFYDLMWEYAGFLQEDSVDQSEKYYVFLTEMISWRKEVLNTARTYLSNPQNLWFTYNRVKPLALWLIRKNCNVREVVGYLNFVLLPIFQPLAVTQISCQSAGKNCSCSYSVRLSNFQADNQYEYEWMMRRRAEGGEQIVATWRNVFLDMAKSLN